MRPRSDDSLSEVGLRMVGEEHFRRPSLLELARRANEAAARVRKVMLFGGLTPPAGPPSATASRLSGVVRWTHEVF